MKALRAMPLAAAGAIDWFSGVYAQQPATPAATPAPTFRASVDLVTSDVIVRNKRGQFQADLSKDDFEVYEDGVKQEVSSFLLMHGGRVFTSMAPPPSTVREGVIL